MLIAGILAISSLLSVVLPNQSLLVATAPSSSEQSAFYTATTDLGDATITEILVNTAVQFPPAGLPSESSPLNVVTLAQLAFLLFIALVLGLRSSQRA